MEKKLLNGVSVMEAETEKQQETHDNMYLSAIDNINLSAGFTACVVPVNHPRKTAPYRFVTVSSFDDVQYMLDGRDFKNGVDVYAIHDGFLFRVYGQSFSRDGGKTWETITEDVIVTRSEYRYF